MKLGARHCCAFSLYNLNTALLGWWLKAYCMKCDSDYGVVTIWLGLLLLYGKYSLSSASWVMKTSVVCFT